jgi:hypothetical protein
MEGGMNDEEKYIADQIGNVKFRGMQGRGRGGEEYMWMWVWVDVLLGK